LRPSWEDFPAAGGSVMVFAKGAIPDSLPIHPIGAFCHVSAWRWRALAVMIRRVVAETGSGQARPEAVWLGDKDAKDHQPRLNRAWFLPPPDPDHQSRLLTLAASLESPEHKQSVASHRGWGGQYARCSDLAAALRLYLAWCGEGEPGSFEALLSLNFPGASIPTPERRAALKAHLAEQLVSGPA